MDPYKPPESPIDAAAVAEPVRGSTVGSVARDLAILWALTFAGGFVIGFASSVAQPNPILYFWLLFGANLVLGAVGFTISGVLARGPRWRHLAIVAVAYWVSSLANIYLTGMLVQQWLFGAIWVAAMMGVGGALSFVFKPSGQSPK